MLKRFLAGAALAVVMLGQTAAPPAAAILDTPALEAYVRHLLVWPTSVVVTIGNPVPAPVAGFYKVTIRGTLAGKTQEETLYVSSDTKSIIRGDIFDIEKNPFQADLDVLRTDNQPFLGTPYASVTVVEFADFQCPYCKQEAGVVRNQLMDAFPKDVRLVYMDYPLDTMHPFARGAAILGRCIYTQSNDSFWAYHDWMFRHQADITAENLKAKVLDYAKGDKNLDVARLTSCALAPEPRADVDRSVAIGDQLHINATPTFFINGRRLVGTYAIDDLRMVVEQEIAYAKTLQKDTDCCSVQLSLPGGGVAPQAREAEGKAAK
jgi:protein-disulfide isomerase